MEREQGTRVRRVHGTPGVVGTILGQAPPSKIDGSERVHVRWEMPDGTTPVSAWAPEMLVKPEVPYEDDPERVLLCIYLGVKHYSTRQGFIKDPPDEEVVVQPMGNGIAMLSRPRRKREKK